MKKYHILSEIKRTAAENDGVPLGKHRFSKTTGIRKEDWEGIHWARWSDALIEAGFMPNRFGEPALDEELMISKIAGFARELGHVPTGPECKMQKQKDAEFPNISTIRRRLGTKTELIQIIKDFCGIREGWDDVLSICNKDEARIQKKDLPDDDGETHGKTGHVYLLKHGKEYKIGRSTDAAKRYGEIRVQMPYRTEEVHVIETDDPSGIEAYWHNRFKDKRLEGEWFALTAADVRAFKKRRFM